MVALRVVPVLSVEEFLTSGIYKIAESLWTLSPEGTSTYASMPSIWMVEPVGSPLLRFQYNMPRCLGLGDLLVLNANCATAGWLVGCHVYKV